MAPEPTNEERLAHLARSVDRLDDGYRVEVAASYLLAGDTAEARSALQDLVSKYRAEHEFWRRLEHWLAQPPLQRCLAHVAAEGRIDALALLTVSDADVEAVIDCLLGLAERAAVRTEPTDGLLRLAALWVLSDAAPATRERLLPRIEPSRWIERVEREALVTRLRAGGDGAPPGQVRPSWVRRLHPAIGRDPIGGALKQTTLAADPLEVFSGALMRDCPGRWVIYGDLDHLKTVNDTCGFAAGDLVLRDTIEALQQVAGDRVIRFGGEELLVIHEGPDGPELAESLRRRVEQTVSAPLDYRDRPVPVTISFGVARAGELVGCLREAEDALDQAKRRGRNTVVVAD